MSDNAISEYRKKLLEAAMAEEVEEAEEAKEKLNINEEDKGKEVDSVDNDLSLPTGNDEKPTVDKTDDSLDDRDSLFKKIADYEQKIKDIELFSQEKENKFLEKQKEIEDRESLAIKIADDYKKEIEKQKFKEEVERIDNENQSAIRELISKKIEAELNGDTELAINSDMEIQRLNRKIHAEEIHKISKEVEERTRKTALDEIDKNNSNSLQIAQNDFIDKYKSDFSVNQDLADIFEVKARKALTEFKTRGELLTPVKLTDKLEKTMLESKKALKIGQFSQEANRQPIVDEKARKAAEEAAKIRSDGAPRPSGSSKSGFMSKNEDEDVDDLISKMKLNRYGK